MSRVCSSAVPFLTFALLGITSCSSSLDEFRCVSHTECLSGQAQGMCHSSGYCAFPDDDCAGFRFGKSSGESSNQCVETEIQIDAGISVPDAGPAPRPTADFLISSLPCGKTEVSLDASVSLSADGSALVSFQWSVALEDQDPMSVNLRTWQGDRDTPVPRGVFLKSGTFEAPSINLTPYADATIVHMLSSSGPDVRLFQRIDALESGDYQLSFAAAHPAQLNQTLSVAIDGSDTIHTDFQTTSSMVSYSTDFSLTQDEVSVYVSFYGTEISQYIDNVSLYRKTTLNADSPDADNRLSNASFETGEAPWTAGGSGIVDRHSLAENFAHYGTYTISLIVTDSAGTPSLPATAQVVHAPCD